MEILPEFATKEGVVAIGEIGFDEQTALEEKYFRLQLDLARDLDLPVMIHTPHRDKKRGASRSMDIIIEHRLSPTPRRHRPRQRGDGARGAGARLLGGVLHLPAFQDDGPRACRDRARVWRRSD